MLLNDEFESKLLLNYELSMDEQAERLRRAQVLEERLSDLKVSVAPEKVRNMFKAVRFRVICTIAKGTYSFSLWICFSIH